MSKISEQKALEAYPMDEYEFDKAKKSNIERSRYAYIKGYDSAMQDFLEKSERYLKNTLYDRVEMEVYGTLIPSITNKKSFIEDFKNYMLKEYNGQNTEES